MSVDSSRIDCEEVLEALEAYCDGASASSLASEIERHLAGCRDCLERRDFVVRLRAVIKDKCGSPQLPPGLEERVRGAITELR